MANTWQVQEAKAKFSEFLTASLEEGPQIVTKRGVETAVLVDINEWRRVQKRRVRSLKEWLLATEARTEELAPPRRGFPLRDIPDFE